MRDADVASGTPTPLALLARAHGFPVAELVEEWEERAAIREYLGGATRDVAEADALSELAAVMMRRHRRLL